MQEYCQPTFIHEQNLFFKLRNIWFKGWTVTHHLYFLKYYTDLQRTLAKQWHFQGMWKLFEKVLMSPSLIPKCGHGKQLPGELVLFKFWMFIAEKMENLTYFLYRKFSVWQLQRSKSKWAEDEFFYNNQILCH